MIIKHDFDYKPDINESEKASGSYIMSLVALIGGLPFPIINLLATLGFFIANRKGTYFVRWHCTQALLSQFSILIINSFGFWWTISIIFGSEVVSNQYIAYIVTVLIFNITEFIVTIYSAVYTSRGIHVSWWLYGDLTDLICKPNYEKDFI